MEKDKKYVFMPRIRSIKPEFFKHDELYQAELDFKLPLRIAFIGLWCSADRRGLFKWRPKQLKLDILPYDNVDFSRVLHALFTRGFIVRYAIDEEIYGCILSFLDHQSINPKEKNSTIPEYDEKCIVDLSDEEINALFTREVRDEYAKDELAQGREGKGREWKGKRKGMKKEETSLTERYGMPLLQVNEKVFLTEKEIKDFIEKFGKEDYEWMIEKLKNHVLANRSGERYADDAAAMRGWVAEALEKSKESKNKNSKNNGKNNQNNKLTADDIQTAYNGVDDICGVI